MLGLLPSLLFASSAMGAPATVGCRASAVRLNSGLGVVVEPAVANAPGTPCVSQSTTVATLPPSLSALLGLKAATAQTTSSAGEANAQSGVIAPLFVGLLGGIEVQALTAHAQEQCVNGTATPSSRSEVVGLTAAGHAYGTVTQPLTIELPGLGTLFVNRTLTASGSVTQQALELSLLPSVVGLGGVDLVLGEASSSTSGNPCVSEGGGPGDGGTLNLPQRAGSGAEGSGLGVGSGVGLPPGSRGTLGFRQAAARLALMCTNRKLVLIDVLLHGNHVAIFGAADRSLIGRKVTIIFAVGHKRVASVVVGPDGFFGTTAPLPPRRVRLTNLARYQARIGRERSRELKLTRRMIVDSLTSLGGQVVIRGHLIRPLARPIATIFVRRRVSCSSSVIVKRIKPHRDGSFTATLAAPPHSQASVYQADTTVRGVASNLKTFPTSTLPRVVVNE